MPDAPEQGFELKRSRRPWWIAGGVIVAAIVVLVIALNATSSGPKGFGKTITVAWDSNPQEQQIINYVAKTLLG